MVERFGEDWAFQYDEDQWKVSKEQYEKFYKHDPTMPNWFEGITQADLFNLKEI
jgi:lysine-tRNA ligase